MPLEIIRNDLVRMHVDAIVNAANNGLSQGGGVCGAIFSAAGAADMKAACDRIGSCETGEAVITPGFRLPARFVVHTAGPVWQGGSYREEQLLRSCYLRSLALAARAGCASVAFPLIASGIYGYPKEAALDVALSAIGAFLRDPACALKAGEAPLPLESGDMAVYLVVFDREAATLAGNRFSALVQYIGDHYAAETEERDTARRRPAQGGPRALKTTRMPVDTAAAHWIKEPGILQDAAENDSAYMASESLRALPPAASKLPRPARDRNLERMIQNTAESFSQHLLRLIDEKGMTDVDAYRRANMDRKLFSKIRSRKDYVPKKPTAVAFAIALGLNLEETCDLLGRAGYALSHSSRADLIVRYCIETGIHDIHEVNRYLFEFNEPLLGA